MPLRSVAWNGQAPQRKWARRQERSPGGGPISIPEQTLQALPVPGHSLSTLRLAEVRPGFKQSF